MLSSLGAGVPLALGLGVSVLLGVDVGVGVSSVGVGVGVSSVGVGVGVGIGVSSVGLGFGLGVRLWCGLRAGAVDGVTAGDGDTTGGADVAVAGVVPAVVEGAGADVAVGVAEDPVEDIAGALDPLPADVGTPEVARVRVGPIRATGGLLIGTAGCDKSLKFRDKMFGELPGLCFVQVPTTWNGPVEEMVGEGLGKTGPAGASADGMSPLSG